MKDLACCAITLIASATFAADWPQYRGANFDGSSSESNLLKLVQGDKGPLVLVEATPKAYNEIARAQPLGGKCWTMAVVANGRIFARNTKEGLCLDVSGGGAQ